MQNPIAHFDRTRLLEAFMALKLAENGKLPLCRGPETNGRLIPIEGGKSAFLASDQMVNDMPALAFNVEQVTKITPFGRSFVFESVKSGALKSRKVGKNRVILARDLLAWLTGESKAA
jgi:hypothetical protein